MKVPILPREGGNTQGAKEIDLDGKIATSQFSLPVFCAVVDSV